MEGPWGTMDPDKVDAETGNFWRALYKLEKQFNEVPNAQKIAARVSLICCFLLHKELVLINNLRAAGLIDC